MNNSTIAAIATGMTNSGIGIIRISGERAFQIIENIFEKKTGQIKVDQINSHTIHYGWIKKNSRILDEVMVTIMKGPNTYTREDSVEINCHGGIHVMNKVLELVLHQGAVIAEPGEFTKRAFLNGRIDLSQAEAVMDVIQSKSDLALKTSVEQLDGVLNKKITELREAIIYEIAFIESALDDPEHVNLKGYPQKLSGVVDNLIKKSDDMLKNCKNGKIIKEGIQTVILGKPNAGKSSLMNVLSGRERAIVTEVEGTTRDILEETIVLDDIILNVIDTAGIRYTKDIVEKIGVEKAKEYAAKADLILYVADGSKPMEQSDEEIISIIDDKKGIVLVNKSDLDIVLDEKELERKTGKPVIMISAKEQTGVDKLTGLLKKMFFEGDIEYNDQLYITNQRHQQAVESARESLFMVKKSIENQMPEDFYSIDLTAAYEQLGFVIGESLEEDLVNEIFSKFCTGK